VKHVQYELQNSIRPSNQSCRLTMPLKAFAAFLTIRTIGHRDVVQHDKRPSRSSCTSHNRILCLKPDHHVIRRNESGFQGECGDRQLRSLSPLWPTKRKGPRGAENFLCRILRRWLFRFALKSQGFGGMTRFHHNIVSCIVE
jgi:hypothetical protein